MAAPPVKRTRPATEIDDIFAAKKVKPAVVPPALSKNQAKQRKQAMALAAVSAAAQPTPKQDKGKGKAVEHESEDREIDEEGDELELDDGEEVPETLEDLARLIQAGKKKRAPIEIVDPSIAIDSYRNAPAPSATGAKGGAGKAKEADEEERFMDSRGTARELRFSPVWHSSADHPHRTKNR